jgi:atypical dual specificity phosphatase
LDIPEEDLLPYFGSSVEVIAARLPTGAAGGRVLVHCMQGKSRSASIVLAYMMAVLGYRLEDALRVAVTARPIVEPNAGFMDQLRKYEATLGERDRGVCRAAGETCHDRTS